MTAIRKSYTCRTGTSVVDMQRSNIALFYWILVSTSVKVGNNKLKKISIEIAKS